MQSEQSLLQPKELLEKAGKQNQIASLRLYSDLITPSDLPAGLCPSVYVPT